MRCRRASLAWKCGEQKWSFFRRAIGCSDSTAVNPTALFRAGAHAATGLGGGIVSVARIVPVSVGRGCGTPKVLALAIGAATAVTARPLVSTGLVNMSWQGDQNGDG